MVVFVEKENVMNAVNVILIILLTVAHVIGFAAAYTASMETPGWSGAEVCCLCWCTVSFMFAVGRNWKN